MELAVFVKDLTKNYGDILALDHINFEVRRGEVFGLLGPNGAGKTTTIKILTGLTKPTSGKALVAGYDVIKQPYEVKKRIGWIAAEVVVDDDLTAWENLELQAKLEGIKDWKDKATDLLKYFGIYEFKDKQVGKFSTGMRKKLEISMALLNSPEVVFMDEPTIGLDVSTRKALWDIIRQINKDFQVSVLLTTHYMEEADMLCERIAIINKGKIVAIGSPNELKEKYGVDVIEIDYEGTPDKKKLEKFGELSINDGRIRIRTKNAENIVADVLRQLSDVKVKAVRVNKTSLDTVFLTLTGTTIEEGEFDARRFYMTIRRARR
ncbi:ATP-binding cassette domain-containing protein [Sulfolobus tengchongensis]|uniref:ATP-binding cassette domain-containing protein n=1 Tax=Sulfolobus tengchongensis TaxID=207809 RepID=A0AAX4L0J4_9CREN